MERESQTERREKEMGLQRQQGEKRYQEACGVRTLQFVLGSLVPFATFGMDAFIMVVTSLYVQVKCAFFKKIRKPTA